MPTNYTDPILDELHAIRREMLAECGGDLQRLVSSLQQREAESGRVLNLPAEDDAGKDVPTKSLKEIMNVIGQQAEARGLTAEEVDC